MLVLLVHIYNSRKSYWLSWRIHISSRHYLTSTSSIKKSILSRDKILMFKLWENRDLIYIYELFKYKIFNLPDMICVCALINSLKKLQKYRIVWVCIISLYRLNKFHILQSCIIQINYAHKLCITRMLFWQFSHSFSSFLFHFFT